MEIISSLSAFNFKPLLLAVLIGVALFFAIQITDRFIIRFIGSNKLRRKVSVWFVIITRLIWGIYSVGSAIALITANQIAGVVIIIVISASTWFYIRNYIAGLFMLFDPEFKVGQTIRVVNYEGTIKNLRTVRCLIELGNGEILSLPYTELTKSGIVKTSPAEGIISHVFSHDVSKPCQLEKVKAKIIGQLIAMPWLLPNHPPIVDLANETETIYSFSITIQGINRSQLKRVELEFKKL